MKHSIILSADGLHTLKLTDFDECYHSTNGAYAESYHIYIKCGVEYLWNKLSGQNKKEIQVYDIGLGTALNAIVTLCWQEELQAQGAQVPHIHYNGIEKYPIAPQEAQRLNFPQHIAVQNPLHLTAQRLEELFMAIHNAEWEQDVEITPHFTLHKHEGDITTVEGTYFNKSNLRYCKADEQKNPSVIMYDTFSPATQPLLWNVEIFRKIAQNVAPGSILTTYCSKGTVKQALRDAGFQLERLSGPPGKRHILRAVI